MIKQRFTADTLAQFLAETVQYSRSELVSYDDPEGMIEHVAFVCSCFLYQHIKSRHTEDGVEMEVAFNGLKMGEDMSDEMRLMVAKEFIDSLWF